MFKWLREMFNQLKNHPIELETRRAFICEEGEDDKELSIIDIKAAIAKQGIPVSDLYSAQDLAANRTVMSLVRDAELKVSKKLDGEIIILNARVRDLQAFKDKREVTELVSQSKLLADKDKKLVDYMKKRFSTGNLVTFTGDLTDIQRQDTINKAIEEELKLVEEMGINFKDTQIKDTDLENPVAKTPFDDDTEKVDMTKSENNPLIPKDVITK